MSGFPGKYSAAPVSSRARSKRSVATAHVVRGKHHTWLQTPLSTSEFEACQCHIENQEDLKKTGRYVHRALVVSRARDHIVGMNCLRA